MSTAQGNIFLTTENLAFSLPLLIVCGIYAYFTFIPLKYGLPILGLGFLAYQIRGQLYAQRAKKIQNMDDKEMSDLAFELEGEELDDDKAAQEEASKKLQKKKNAVSMRLGAEKRKEEKAAKAAANAKGKKKKTADDEDEADVADMAMFVKGPQSKKKN